MSLNNADHIATHIASSILNKTDAQRLEEQRKEAIKRNNQRLNEEIVRTKQYISGLSEYNRRLFMEAITK